MDSSGLEYEQTEDSCECGNERSGSITCWEAVEQLSHWRLLKKYSVPWSQSVRKICGHSRVALILQELLFFCAQNRNLGAVLWWEINIVLHHTILYSGSVKGTKLKIYLGGRNRFQMYRIKQNNNKNTNNKVRLAIGFACACVADDTTVPLVRSLVLHVGRCSHIGSRSMSPYGMLLWISAYNTQYTDIPSTNTKKGGVSFTCLILLLLLFPRIGSSGKELLLLLCL
jgi:hypothetical protein